MKLKCVEHERRVLVLPSKKTIHREDGSECASERLHIGRLPQGHKRYIFVGSNMADFASRPTHRKGRSYGKRGH